MFELLLPALVVGSMVAILCAPLGCFVVWRRMSYFGDTMAHSGLLGVALGLMLGLHPVLAVILLASVIAIMLFYLGQKRDLAEDTLLGILSHGSLALGLVVMGLLPNQNMDLNALLFGDLLLTSWQDAAWTSLLLLAVLSLLAYFWRPLLAMSVHADLAKAEGIASDKLRLLLLVMIAVVIAIAMKVVGILLITSLLIIPAATARRLASSPESMAVIAGLVGLVSIWAGMALSYQFDTPSGPSVVIAALTLFLLSLTKRGD